ncbi:MAG TPA: anaerobic carbon-monoxide dehydrogenase catalytic subunit [Armatimonadetes bacterium]|nr:anaerobic carbon-monoxide dehydrogenase catalytic subunit [Armatimonadota bacterium]
MAGKDNISICPATLEMLERAHNDGIATIFDRADAMRPCPIGRDGICCKLCAMGPCRLTARRGEEIPTGVCGASQETVVARNFARMIAGGAAAHADHGRAAAEVLMMIANGETSDYEIKDEMKLLKLAMDFGVETSERSIEDIARDVARIALEEFGKQEGELRFISRAPLRRQELWRELGVVPRGIDREITEMLHRTHIGTDQDYEHILMHAIRVSLADGWGGSMLATELQDVLFGTPYPTASRVNLGVLKPDHVNIIVHGHEPLLSEMVVLAAREPQMVDLARSKGAQGINIAGICCTANEVLMRHGIPLAGNFLQQEMALLTGVVDVMVVDVQCILQSLPEVAECYHGQIITTSPRAKIAGAMHIEFSEHNALELARKVVQIAIDKFANRNGDGYVPNYTMDLVAGFSHETINYLLGGLFRASYKPLNDNIINGRIRGVAGVVGCNNPRVTHDSPIVTLVKELIKNDVLVLQTGCAAMACAKAGLMNPEMALQYTGDGLGEVCEAVGIPPVLHMGSCVDNSRILIAATAMVKEGGLGDDISELPAAGAAPEWMSEKALAIGMYFVASGVFTVFGVHWPTVGNDEVTDWLFNRMERLFKAKWACEPDPEEAAKLMIKHIDEKRKALGIDKARERILFDMAMRRELEAV